MYTEKEIVAVASRENNNKRKYLVVNRMQCKHIPVSPTSFFNMTSELAEIVKESYIDEKLLLVGFAETATAIGAALAVKLDTLYMQTTRENIDGVKWLYFTESHSHATEQKLVRDDIEKIIAEIDRIVFVEDEVTTGNTILKIIDIIEREYGKRVKFSVASVLNGMNESSYEVYKKRNIGISYLVKTDHSSYTAIAERYKKDGKYFEVNVNIPEKNPIVKNIAGGINARRLVKGSIYDVACNKLWREIKSVINRENEKNILVIGTEEFMYPAIYIAFELEKEGYNVKCHSTTRSPIAVSSEDDYPLSRRYELVSLYDEIRVTYIYNLQNYDSVLIITDSQCASDKGVNSLINALHTCGNENIKMIKWENNEDK